MLAKLNKITSLQASFIIAIVGLATFISGLSNQFQGDDLSQIVNNIPVHSITNLRIFFEGGTFYNGQGTAPLTGIYYRPLMTTVFSLLYSLFGSHPVTFHLLQLLLCIGSAIFLFLFFRYSLRPAVALFLALVFLVHPLNSQVAFGIPSMQDALFFFFGILALWLLLWFDSVRGLLPVAACLFLALLSKETGILFVAMACICLFWFDRKRLYAFMSIMVLPIALWLVLKIHAVGLDSHSHNAPIDSLNIIGRLFTAPSVLLFFITKFLFPLKLASAYYWIYPTFSFWHVLSPLVIDLAVIAVFAYLAGLIRTRASMAMYHTYLFFASWTLLGLIPYLQIIPLDMTVCETWFYFSMAGVLGMIGVVLTVFPPRIRPEWVLVVGVLLIGFCGLRTGLRGFDWKNQCTIATHDFAVSKEDYVAATNIGQCYYNQGNLNEAKVYAVRSVNIYPTFTNYSNLGAILANLGDYPGAKSAYANGLKYGNYSPLYDNLGALTLVYGDPNTNKQFLLSALEKFPQDPSLWMYLAILEDRYNDNADAQIAITKAATYGQVGQVLYSGIMNNQPFTLDLGKTGGSIKIQ